MKTNNDSNDISWNKETDDLFDFEAKDITTKEFKIGNNQTSNYLILQDPIEIKKKISEKNSTKILGEISTIKNGMFQISNPLNSSKLKNFEKSNLDRLWVVLPRHESRLIEEGDILKLGRVRLKVDKIEIKRDAILNSEGNCQNISGCNYLKTNTTVQIIHNNNMLNINMNIFQNNNILNQSLNNSIAYNNHNNLFNLNLMNEMNISQSSLNGISAICANNNTSNKKFNPLHSLSYDHSMIIQNKTHSEKLLKSPLNKEIFNCRICFRSDSDFEDPLVSPCKCAGSIGYIHYKCLKQCINVKLSTKIGDNCMTFIWKNFECEICLAEYPKYIRYKHTCYYLVDLNINFDQYVVFDYTLYDDSKKKSVRKGIIVVRISEDEDITIGRTQTNTIKLKDISVSRNHCLISKKENKMYITDKGSKFGTLIYLTKPFVICEKTNEKPNEKIFEELNVFYGANLDVVTGKNHLNFQITRKWSLFANIFYSAMCCNYKKENQNEYILDHEEIICKNEIFPIKANNINGNINNQNGMNPHLLYDSYCDHILNLDTIIRHSEQDD